MTRILAAAAVGMGSAIACGPSVQLIYEGNIRFEHCNRLDFDPRIAPTHRHACWAEWTDLYAKGQTRDRLEYARRRLAALASGDGGALTLHLDRDVDAGPMVAAVDPVPVPTSPYAPPPAVLAPVAPSSSASTDPPDAGTAVENQSISGAKPEVPRSKSPATQRSNRKKRAP